MTTQHAQERHDLVPGVMSCAKCKFQLTRTNLNMTTGTASAGDSQTEPCPNGCGPLWPVTWKQWATEHAEIAERLFYEKQKAEQQLAALQVSHDGLAAALEKYGRHKTLCADSNGYGDCNCGFAEAIINAQGAQQAIPTPISIPAPTPTTSVTSRPSSASMAAPRSASVIPRLRRVGTHVADMPEIDGVITDKTAAPIDDDMPILMKDAAMISRLAATAGYRELNMRFNNSNQQALIWIDLDGLRIDNPTRSLIGALKREASKAMSTGANQS